MRVTAVGVSFSRIALADGATATALPLTFICTDAFPSVSSSEGAVSVGILSAAVNVRSLISFAPDPFTRHTYTVPVGTSWRVTFVGLVTAGSLAGVGWCRGRWRPDRCAVVELGPDWV